MFAANSLIFVPGSRPDRFAKAQAAGAGLAVIDLEDAVAPADKATARATALQQAGKGFAIRMNAVSTEAGQADLAAFADAAVDLPWLLVPMVESADELGVVRERLGGSCPALIPLIETPKGLRQALEIAASDRVSAVLFGGVDFASELGIELAWEPLLTARSMLLLACAEAKVPAIDMPFIGLDDPAGLAIECAKARALGFSAKAAIHPGQIATIEAAFAPSAAAIAEAEAAVAAYVAAGEEAIRFRGRMLEAPLVARYRAVLRRSGKL